MVTAPGVADAQNTAIHDSDRDTGMWTQPGQVTGTACRLNVTAARRVLENRYMERYAIVHRARIADPARIDPEIAAIVCRQSPRLGNADRYTLALLATHRAAAHQARIVGSVLDDAWAALTGEAPELRMVKTEPQQKETP